MRELSQPATEEEARALITLFGEDSLFGLAWALVHMIESAPGWPYWDELADLSNPCRALLHQRLRDGGERPPA